MPRKVTSLAHRMRRQEYEETLEKLEVMADEVMILRGRVAQLEGRLPVLLPRREAENTERPHLTIVG